MKPVLLSADRDIFVYEVPDNIAKKLHNRCLDFISYYNNDPDFKRKHFDSKLNCVRFDVIREFIEYIDKLTYANFNNEKCVFIENLGNISEDEIPEKYKKCNWFNF